MPNHMPPNFFIKNFTIHSVEGASCVNIGSNHPIGFTSFKKHNQGFGSVSGSHNTIEGLKTLLSDKSLFDMFADSDAEDRTWVNEIKELVLTKVMEYLEEAEIGDGEEESNLDFDDIMEFLDEPDEDHETYKAGDENEAEENNDDDSDDMDNYV